MGHQAKSHLIVVDTDVGMMPRILRDSSHCLNKINCLQEGLELEGPADLGLSLTPARTRLEETCQLGWRHRIGLRHGIDHSIGNGSKTSRFIGSENSCVRTLRDYNPPSIQTVSFTMRFSILPLIAAAANCMVFLSCTAVTPEWRINQNASLYKSLSEEHRRLASKGEITKGMPQNAVYFAMGNPTRKIRGYHADASFERWEYLRRQPHFHHSLYAYQGLGFGRHGGNYGGFGLAPSIHYTPTHAATVTFRNGVVDSWETSNFLPSSP